MKKVLSFVLVLSLVLGSFSMAFAATPTTGLSDIAGSANKDAIQAAFDLGIVTGNPDGTYLPTKAVNRAEFAAMITRAMAVPDSALAGYTATTFKDTAGYDWAVKYLAFCETKGIILGDGQGNVMPGRTITVNEAVTMVLRAVGYTSNSNELIGAWPSNYVTLAQNLELYDDVANVGTVDKANAAQILYNALTLTKVVVDTEGKTTAAAGSKSLMTGNLGATVVTGATIDGSKFGNTSININGLIGKYGTKYEDKDGKLLAFDPSSKALYGKMKVGSTTIFIADGVEYTLPTTSGAVLAKAITNAGSAVENTTTLGGLLAVADSGKVTLNVKLNGTTIETIRSAVAWNASNNAKINAAQIEDITKNKTLLGGDFARANDSSIDTAQFNLLGASSLSSIAKDNVVYIYKDTSNKIRQIAVGTKTVEGKVTAKNVTAAIGDAYVVVNGTKYFEATEIGANGLPAVSDNAQLFLDYFGDSYSFKLTNTPNKYGVVVGYATESALSNAKAKIYTSADSATVYDFVGNGDIAADTAVTGFIADGGVVKYRLDANGKIDTIEKGVIQTTTTGITVTALSTKVLQYTVSSGATKTTTNYAIASDVVVFSHNSTTTGYAVINMTDVNLGVQLVTNAAYGVSFILNSDGDVGALVVDYSKTTTSTSDSYGVVNTVADSTNSSDKPVQTLSGFLGKTAFADKLTDNRGDFTFYQGAAYAFKMDSTGTITQVTSLGAVNVVGSDEAKKSGYIVQNYKVTATNSDRTMLTVSNGSIETKVGVAADAVVYKLVVKADGTSFDKYEVGSLTDINVNDQVWAYDTKGRDANGVATMVIYKDL